MKKIINILLAVAFIMGPVIILSQGYYNRYEYRRKRHEISFGAGASNFLGELGGRDMIGSGFLWDLEIAKTSYVGQFSYVYYALSKLALRGNIAVAKVSGDDKLTTEFYRQNRNLNFQSLIIEGGLFVEVHLKHERTGNRYNLKSPAGRYLGMRNPIGIGIYTFTGIGLIYFDPTGQNSVDGVRYKLKPLKTEGQGLPGGAKPYSGISACLPVGFGFRKAFNGNSGLKFEASYRFTFTDYIDDVSTVYYNNDELAASVSPIAAQMADPGLGATYEDYRATHVGVMHTHTETGMQRGDASDNDGYMFVTLSAYKKFNNAARGYRTINIHQKRKIKASF